MVVGVWVLPLALLAPTWAGRWGRFDLDAAVGSCSIMKDDQGRSPKEVLFVVAFLLPAAAIALCYARIFCISRRAAARATRAPRRRRRQRPWRRRQEAAAAAARQRPRPRSQRQHRAR
ncbi:hypothetical protein R5R35_011227 [Gryllus longicercus]|uniref:G-protein coupled receptors family 1 profile domain-containing protein n=1 Tax=Gryllus longicercus TaxID=2509291 RepID=A0AAN9VI59_9ORTH